MASVSGHARQVGDWARKYPLAPRWDRRERRWLRTADGVRLFAAELDGPPDAACSVVLLHGFLNSSRSPKVHAFARRLARDVHVVVPDLRGHGASGGHTTLGIREPLDVAAAVRLASRRGLPVVTVGTSLGGLCALLHAGSHGGVAGVVSLSSPGLWLHADRAGAQRLGRFVERRAGRAFAAALLRTRIGPYRSEVPDVDGLVGRIAPAFTLLIHDPDDAYFGPEHAEHLYAVARDPKELRWAPGAGHGIDLLTEPFAEALLGDLRTRLPRAPSR